MQEPKRNNVLNCLTKSLNVVNQKSFLHRLIYLIKYGENTQNNYEEWKIFKNKFKNMNADESSDTLSGLIIHSLMYVTCIVEGSEDCIKKHIAYLASERKISQPKNKILLIMPHIAKAISVKPPTLLDDLSTCTDPAGHAIKLKQCITKLLKLAEYLNYQNENQQNDVCENLSMTCKRILPEATLLEFLLDSPVCQSINDHHQIYQSPLPYQLYHDAIWPAAPPFIPATPQTQHKL